MQTTATSIPTISERIENARYASTGTLAPTSNIKMAEAPEKTRIPIFFTIDDSYAPYLGIALVSLIENASKDYEYDLVILHQHLSDEHLAKLKALERPGFNLRFVPMDDEIEGITNRYCNKLRQDYFTLTIFFRLFIPSMFPEYDKGIYLDSDIVVPGDISRMYNIELGDNLLGGCPDHSVADVPELANYIEKGVGVDVSNYINSGVLLMNLKALRQANLDRRFLELLATYHFDNLAPDQDYLNVLCKDKIVYLDSTWDSMPVEGKDEFEHPQLIHYNLFAKPWCYDNIPYADYFWHYAKMSDFLDEAIACKQNYSDEQKASDTACMMRMLEHGKELSESSFNFRVVFESGQEARL